MTIYTVKLSAPAGVDEATRQQFEAQVLELWRAAVEGRAAIVSVEPMVGAWPRCAGPQSTPTPEHPGIAASEG